MTWELVQNNFPIGHNFNEAPFINRHQMLKQFPNVEILTLNEALMARDMVIQEHTHIYGKNNEYALGVTYDVFNGLPRVGKNHVFNVYGASMLQDYIYLNGITKEELSDA